MRCRATILTCVAAAAVLGGCGKHSDTDALTNTTPIATHPTVAPSTKAGPAPAFGVNLGTYGFVHPDAREQSLIADKTRQAGGTVLRLPVPWFQIQPAKPADGAPPTYTFAAFTAIKAAMHRNGIRPLLLIIGTPNWFLPQPWRCPTPANCDGAPTQAHMKDLGLFVQALVKEFPDAIAIEPYNEVNTAINWGPAPVNVKTYATTLATVHNAVRAAHSTIPVITSGLVNFRQAFPGDLDAPEFLNELYKDGAKGSFEGIGLHPYASTADPSAPGGYWLGRINAARKVASLNGDAGRPIWITESGYPTGGKSGWTVVVSEKEQSRLEQCEYRLLVGSPDIRVVLHNFVYDNKAPGKSESLEDYWGLFRSDGAPKPIVTGMASLLSHPTKVTSCSSVH